MKDIYIPKAYLDELITQARQAGCDVEHLIEKAGIEDLDLTSDKEIRARSYGELYRQIMRFTQNEWFGMFTASERVPLGAFRMMGLAVLQCSDLQQAIFRASDFSEICRGINTRHYLERNDYCAILKLAPIRSFPIAEFDRLLGKASPDSIVTTLLTWHRFSEWLIDKEIPLIRVNLSCSEGELKLPLVHANLTSIEYNQASNSVVYSQHFLDHPIVQNQESLSAFLRTAPYHLVTKDPSHTSPAEKVRGILNRDVSGAMPSAEQVASHLNVSVTTLRRQLQKEGTSFQRIKDECRTEAAFHYLNYAELTNTDIADRLGFDEPSAFFRSFKKWTGMTPGEYRASLK